MRLCPCLCDLFVDDVDRWLIRIEILGVFQKSVLGGFGEKSLIVSALNGFWAGQAHDVRLHLLPINVGAYVAQFEILLLLQQRNFRFAYYGSEGWFTEGYRPARRLLSADCAVRLGCNRRLQSRRAKRRR